MGNNGGLCLNGLEEEERLGRMGWSSSFKEDFLRRAKEFIIV